MDFNIGDKILIHASPEELASPMFQAIDGLPAEISEVYTERYEPDVKRFEVTLEQPVNVNGERLLVISGLYEDNIEKYTKSEEESLPESVTPKILHIESFKAFNESIESEPSWYFGLADCHGIESFIKEPFTSNAPMDMDMLFDLGLMPTDSSNDPDKRKYNAEVGMMVRRAHANPQRWPVIYRALLDQSDARFINDQIDEGEYEEALNSVKALAKTVQVARGMGGDPKKRWDSIPNPELDSM